MERKLQAMAEPTRLEILRKIWGQELPAGEIAAYFKNVTRPAISQHLQVLKEAGLVEERREGTKRLYRLDPDGFAEIKILLEHFCDPRLQRLKDFAQRWRRWQ